MAGRLRKNATNPAKPTAKRGRKSKTVVEEVIVENPVVEEVITETPVVAEEAKTEKISEELITEVLAEEFPEEEVKSVEETSVVAEEEPKPKRKYTRRAKTVEETPVVAEEEPKPKRKYTRREKTVEVPDEVPTAPKLLAYIQGAGAEITLEELSAMAVKLSGVKSPKSVNLYIKPYEDDGVAKVYYVVDNKAGHFNLFN